MHSRHSSKTLQCVVTVSLYLDWSRGCTGNDSCSGEDEWEGEEDEEEGEGAQEWDGAYVEKLLGRGDEASNGKNGAGIGESEEVPAEHAGKGRRGKCAYSGYCPTSQPHLWSLVWMEPHLFSCTLYGHMTRTSGNIVYLILTGQGKS